ncbi:MAG: UvrD-helicase domain-containing protein [Holosporales bacterium]|nr:UvrD-helicase domain-containing protein [Holosporales bacterium]
MPPIHDPNVSLWIEASAGTGKTKTLVDRLLALLLSGVMPSKILCITFTKAAALEMQERLERHLVAWQQDEILSETLKKEGFLDADPAQVRGLFEKILRTPVRFHTLHSFCQSVLECFGSTPQTIIESVDQDLFLERSLDIVLKNMPDSSVLNTAFRRISHLIDRKTLLESFKSILRDRALLEALARCSFPDLCAKYAAAFGVPPEHLSQQEETFFDEAIPLTLKEHVRCAAEYLALGTKTERLCAQDLQTWLEKPSTAETFELLTAPFLTKDGSVRARLQSSLEETARLVLQVHEQWKLLQAARGHLSMAHFLSAIFLAYTRLKEQEQVLDFDDLIFKARALVTEQGAESVLYALDGGIDHILLDEAQDTSREQWEVLLALSAEFFCNHDSTQPARSLCVVGDRKQSIYSFQGANSDYLEAVKAFCFASSDKWKNVCLEKSFRSTPVVLESVDQTFRSPEITPGVCYGHALRHLPDRTEIPGVFELWPIVTANESPSPPDPWTVPKNTDRIPTPEEKLAAHIAQFIRHHHIAANTFAPSCKRPVYAEDFLILMQRRGSLMAALRKALRKEGIAVASTDRIALHEEILVDDLLAAARFALYPEDDLTLASLLKSPFFGWSEEALFEACRAWKKTAHASLWAFIRARARPIVSTLEEWIEFAGTSSPYAFFLHVLQQTDVTSGREQREIADALLEVALTFEKENTPSLERFVTWFKAQPVFHKRATTPVSGVRLMTVHGAKGLQAPFVILADATSVYERVQPLCWSEEGMLFWISQATYRVGPALTLYHKAQEENERESERLLYVAMTRAQDALYITGIKRQRPVSSKSWYTLVKDQLDPLMTERSDILQEGSVLTFAHASLGKYTQDSLFIRVEHTVSAIPSWFSHRLEESFETPVSSEQEGGYARGLAIHKLLEELPKYPTAFWKEKGQEIANICAPSEAKTILDEAIEVLVTYRAFFVDPTASEISFFSPEKGVGRIDRLCVTEEAIWLIDFKTDRQIPQHYRYLPFSYQEQLRFYYEAFAYSQKPIKAALLWTAEPFLMEVPAEFLKRPLERYSSALPR